MSVTVCKGKPENEWRAIFATWIKLYDWKSFTFALDFITEQ